MVGADAVQRRYGGSENNPSDTYGWGKGDDGGGGRYGTRTSTTSTNATEDELSGFIDSGIGGSWRTICAVVRQQWRGEEGRWQ